MADREKPAAPVENDVGVGEGREVSEEDATRAERLKNKANEFFKCELAHK